MTSLNLLYAYIDPFSGSILLQLVIASVIGAIGFSRNVIRKLILKATRRG